MNSAKRERIRGYDCVSSNLMDNHKSFSSLQISSLVCSHAELHTSDKKFVLQEFVLHKNSQYHNSSSFKFFYFRVRYFSAPNHRETRVFPSKEIEILEVCTFSVASHSSFIIYHFDLFRSFSFFPNNNSCVDYRPLITGSTFTSSSWATTHKLFPDMHSLFSLKHCKLMEEIVWSKVRRKIVVTWIVFTSGSFERAVT